jgi:CcmD family protein
MTYVLAAYGVTIAALVGYAIQLLRARKRLHDAAPGRSDVRSQNR